MKHLIFFLNGLLMLSLMSCNSADCLQGSGRQVTQLRDIAKFSTIEIHGNMKLVLKQSPLSQLRITADDNLQEHISAKMKRSRLVIEMDRDLCDTTPVIIYASSPQLDGVEVSGSVYVSGDGPINSQSFDLGMSGASKASLDIRCADLNTHTSGDSELTLKGQAGTHDLKMTGSSVLNAFDLVVGIYNINTSGASDLNINVLNELNVESSGSSNIKYRGKPKHITNDKSGASSIQNVR